MASSAASCRPVLLHLDGRPASVVQFRDDIYGRDGVDELQISSTSL